MKEEDFDPAMITKMTELLQSEVKRLQ